MLSLSAILSFLGGSAFRLMMGEIVSFLSSRQEQKHTVEMMRVQAELEASQHARQLEGIRLQAELGVKTIQVQAEKDVSVAEAEAFKVLVAEAQKPTGIVWIDAWNASIRPAFGTICLALWGLSLYRTEFKLTEWDTSLMAVIIGFYFADRSLRKVGR